MNNPASQQNPYTPATPPSPPPAGTPMPPAAPSAPRPAPVPLPRTKNKFLTFLFALIPGAGAMYHGLLKRGISLMTMFAAVIAIAAFLYLPVVTFVLPILWFYSFFDTVNRMNMPVEELRRLPDGYLFIEQLDHTGDAAAPALQRLFNKRHLIIGWFLVIFSIWLILKLSLSGIPGFYYISDWLPEQAHYTLNAIVNLIPSLVLPAFCIVIGFKLIKGKPEKPATYDEYTIPHEKPRDR